MSFVRVARSATVLVAAAGSIGALAAEQSAYSPKNVMAARQGAVAAAQAKIAASRATVARTPGTSREVVANPFRAYPPSCLSDGLPFRSFPQSGTDPAPIQRTLTLPGDPSQCLAGGNVNECIYSEPVTVTAWRVACSGGNSAVLVEFDRAADKELNTTLYPTFPAIAITQNGQQLYPVRLADDPNTFFSITYANSPVFSSDIFVLENYFDPGQQQIDYNKGFSLNFDNTVTITFGDYNPNQYAAASQAVPISGYLSTNWYDPNHNGEGMLVQVYDNGDGLTRTFTAAWYTFDNLGIPYWLFAQGAFDIGARSTGNVDTFYGSNGGFAGNFGSSATFTKWGTINVSFPDCNHMSFSFNGTTGDANGPAGSGTRTNWQRLANINSLVCE